MDKNNFAKQSIVAGGLTSTAGIFLSKVMGILYVVPFSAMAGTPVTLKTDQGGTDPTLLYEMNVTVERLETTH